MIRRRLAATSKRLKTLRADYEVTGEQIHHLVADAEDAETRALVAENTGISRDAREAREHVDAMRRHHNDLAEEIAQLERRQDELLDELTSTQ